jgi:TolB-like protein/thioredoxin-like negative regulator of GroEL
LSLFQELKRRNVIKVGLAYVVVAWLVAQVLQLVFESFGTPDWVMKTVLVLMAMGLVFALFFAWAFELTPEGLKREREVDRSQSITPQTGKRLNHLITFLMAMAIAYFAYDKFILGASPEPAMVEAASSPAELPDGKTGAGKTAATAKSVAVLPFVDMSPDKDQEYFTDGLTENLLNALAQLRELKVAGRTSSFAFKNRNEDLRSIGEQLGVAHVLEGSVQKSGEKVRITAQLVSAGDGYHLWSQTYDRTLNDIFAVQDEIASAVASAMQVTLLGQQQQAEPRQAPQNNGTAYNDYLKGLHEQHSGTMAGHQRASDYFRRALQQEPNLAQAWAALSISQNFIAGFADEDFTVGFEEARSSAKRALEIDPNLPEAHLALASIQKSHDWDWAAAEDSLDRALALRPGDTRARRLRAELMAIVGKRDEAFGEYQQVVGQDPLDFAAQRSLARAFMTRGQYDEAQRILDHLRDIDPDRPGLYATRARLWFDRGDYQGALEEFSREPFEFFKLTGQAIMLHHLQQPEQAKLKLQQLISTMGESSSYQIAEVYAQWGDADNAMTWLERGYNIRDPGLQYIATDRFFNPIKDDPRFQAFLRKMNLGGQAAS